MNYRHAFHAGNFADVVKHLALVSILIHLQKKASGFAVIDSHAGRGLYDLHGAEALRSGEAASGIARLDGLRATLPTLATYLDLVSVVGAGRYPGSPLIAARLLRDQDRLVAIEKHPEEARSLGRALAPFERARVVGGDGYSQIRTLLPPPERRGLLLIDPPFEATDEFAQAAKAVAEAQRRFATGIVLVWFPIKSFSAANAFCGEVLLGGPKKLLRIDFAIDAPEGKLGAAGLLILNPPFGFAEDMEAVLAAIASPLGRSSMTWLAGSAAA
jgi:23S rRNA (adenine2030-N6)-methyltransferase